MEFFSREEELKELRKVRETARKYARFTAVTGRRRVGKTEQLKKAFADGKTPCPYLLVTRKTEKVQCEAFQREVEKVLGIRIPGRCGRFREVFEEILAASLTRTFTVVIDEFQEFGRDYGTCFTNLAPIASGRTTFAEIKNELGVEVGGYLTKLEDDYSLISKKQPIFEKTANKNSHYQIDDCFFRFWFRFVYKYQYLVELRALVKRDLNVFCGYSLERYFYRKSVEDTSYTRMGGWWDRKGENEIDLVCDDEFADKIVFHEVKMDSKRIDLQTLKEKATAFFAKNPELKGRKASFRALSVKDM